MPNARSNLPSHDREGVVVQGFWTGWNMAKNRTPSRLRPVLVPVGLLLLATLGMWLYMRITAPVLHPNPQEVPSVTYSAPLPRWAGAVKQAVAAGVDGDLVWAEGF